MHRRYRFWLLRNRVKGMLHCYCVTGNSRERLNKFQLQPPGAGSKGTQRFYAAQKIQAAAASAFGLRCGGFRTHYAAAIPSSFVRGRKKVTPPPTPKKP